MLLNLIKIKAALGSDTFTNTAAGFAVISPLWLPVLQDISTFAALMLPIIGVLWLIIQIWSKLYRGK